MHVVAVDTNVFISTLLGKSFPFQITRELILKKKIICSLSREVIREYERVIAYPKFVSAPGFKTESIKLIESIKSVSVMISPGKKFKLSPDEDDNKFLDLVYASNADFLITGNVKHFPVRKFHQTEIISPQKYWNTYWKQ